VLVTIICHILSPSTSLRLESYTTVEMEGTDEAENVAYKHTSPLLDEHEGRVILERNKTILEAPVGMMSQFKIENIFEFKELLEKYISLSPSKGLNVHNSNSGPPNLKHILLL
jgi:hypothetical protein